MSGIYDDILHQASRLFVEALLEREDDLVGRARQFDGDLKTLLFALGALILSMLLACLARTLVATRCLEGFGMEEHHTISVCTLFGVLQMPSPYLRDRDTRRGARPVAEQMGLYHRARTLPLERALTDFGAEKSFARAADRFAEHYGWRPSTTTVQRVTKRHAQAIEGFVQARLETEAKAYEQPLDERPGVEGLLVELDGCTIRTGVLVPHPEGGTTPVLALPRRQRTKDFREVRVGMVRELGSVEKTFVAQMDGYPVVVEQLFAAAVSCGLSERTQVVSPGDGGNGLMEALARVFPNLQYILDVPHLRSHLYETAEALGHADPERAAWVQAREAVLGAGNAALVIKELQLVAAVEEGEEPSPAQARAGQLAKHLTRFKDCLHYEAYKAADWPIGSGEIESAHRQIPQPRLKIAGACWHPDTINPMLALRVARANGWWPDYWEQQAQQLRAAG